MEDERENDNNNNNNKIDTQQYAIKNGVYFFNLFIQDSVFEEFCIQSNIGTQDI